MGLPESWIKDLTFAGPPWCGAYLAIVACAGGAIAGTAWGPGGKEVSLEVGWLPAGAGAGGTDPGWEPVASGRYEIQQCQPQEAFVPLQGLRKLGRDAEGQ